MNIRHPNSREEWNAAVARLPGAHVLQSWEWGECKTRFGWTAERRFWENDHSEIVAAAQILRRTARVGPFSAAVIYLPKGPLLDWREAGVRGTVLSDLETLARRERAIQLKIDPDLVLGSRISGSEPESANPTGAETAGILRKRGWRFSPEQIQFRNTVLLDIRPEESALLAAMKQKTRYNIRLAEKRGVTVRAGSEQDLPALYRFYAETANRDRFVIRSEEYYLSVWSTMIHGGLAQPLIAEYDGLPLAALILLHFADRGWYMYGMSSAMHREQMPNHLLQWEAIRWLRAHGYAYYDLYGAPDSFSESDRLWGVYQFKLGFGAPVVRHIGAWDFAPAPLPYTAYNMILPRILDLTRFLARRRTRTLVEAP